MKKGLGILFALISFVICGFAIMNLWNWFIVPLGVISITFWHAIGIDMLITLIVTTRYHKIGDEWEQLKQAVYSIILPLFSWGLGWAVHMFL